MRRFLCLLACAVAATIARPARSADAAPAISVPAIKIVRADAGRILRSVRSSGGSVVVVNMWATWCIPCREEFPDLLRLRDRYADRGVEVIFVSGDFDATLPQVKEFLAEHGVTRSYLKAGNDTKFIDSFDPDWSGALPATFIYDAAGKRRYSLLGKTTYEALEAKVTSLLGTTNGR